MTPGGGAQSSRSACLTRRLNVPSHRTAGWVIARTGRSALRRLERRAPAPMPLGICIGGEQFDTSSGPGPFEFLEVCVEVANSPRLGRARFSALRQSGLGDLAQESVPGTEAWAAKRILRQPT